MIPERLSCTVTIAGVLPPAWWDLFPDLEIHTAGCDTVLAGRLPDQAVFHGMCTTIRDLGLSILVLHLERAPV